MSEIENGFKKYIEHFGKEIVKNLDELNFYYKHEFLFFCEFGTIIYENLNCLLLGLYQASICMTNHLLERMLKYALLFSKAPSRNLEKLGLFRILVLWKT